MPCGWEGNRRSGVALAMRHRLQWFFHLQTYGLDRDMSTPPTLCCGIWPIYLLPIIKYRQISLSGYYLNGCDLSGPV